MKNKAYFLQSLDEIIQHWPFFLEGLDELNDTSGARANMKPDDLFRVIMDTVLGDPTEGCVIVLTSKNDKLLAYGIVSNNSDFVGPKTAVGWALYSNGNCKDASKDVIHVMEQWARSKGYKELHCQSRRINGAAVRLFERRFGFTRYCLLFKKVL